MSCQYLWPDPYWPSCDTSCDIESLLPVCRAGHSTCCGPQMQTSSSQVLGESDHQQVMQGCYKGVIDHAFKHAYTTFIVPQGPSVMDLYGYQPSVTDLCTDVRMYPPPSPSWCPTQHAHLRIKFTAGYGSRKAPTVSAVWLFRRWRQRCNKEWTRCRSAAGRLWKLIALFEQHSKPYLSSIE